MTAITKKTDAGGSCHSRAVSRSGGCAGSRHPGWLSEGTIEEAVTHQVVDGPS